MMTRHKTHGFWMLAVLMLIVGCIPSLNPVYTDETITFDSALLGVWKQPATKARWDFAQLDEKTYRLVYADETGQQGRFLGRLAKLDGELFLDLYPEEVKMDANGFYKFHLVPIHTIYRVQKTNGQWSLAAIDFQWLDDYLTNHPGEIDFATFNGRKMITGPTAAVQKFVLEHKEMFNNKFELQKMESSN